MAAIFGYDDVGNHASMLVDAVRMRAFADAIARAVRPDDVVIDVGAGSGVLSLLCAKAGARRVYAVERGPMARLIELAAEKNGFADVIRVHRGDARDLRFGSREGDRTAGFDARPTLLISEMIGSFGLDEDYLGLLGAVLAQCAPGCRVLPASVDLQLALATLPGLTEEIATVRDGLGVRLDDVADMLLSRVTLTWVGGESIVSSCTTPAHFSVGDRPPRALGGSVVACGDVTATAIVGWFNSELVEGVTLTSNPAGAKTHWANIVFPLHPPLELANGETVELEVRPRLLTDRGTWSWSAKVAGKDGAPARSRSGDAMKSIVGDKKDLMRALGLREITPLDPRTAELLPIWSAALAGGIADSATLVARVRAAFPERYADDEDAESDVARLVRAAGG